MIIKKTPSGQMAKLLMATSFIGMSTHTSAFEYNGPKVTFEQIYNEPGNNDLKLNYARQQAAQGDLLSAAGTVEGLLYAQPNWDSARLFYAILLYELDDRSSAMREFDLLSARPLSPEDQALVAQYRQGVADRTAKDEKDARKASVSGRVQVGARTDSNAGRAISDSFLGLSSQRDESIFVSGGIFVKLPLSEEGEVALNLRGRAQTRKHDTFTSSDYDVFGATAGLSGKASGLLWKADLLFDTVSLDGETFLDQLGGRLSVGKKISDKSRLSLVGKYYDQDYKGLSINNGENQRSGSLYGLGLNLYTRRSDSLSYSAQIGYDDKNARTDELAYQGYHIGLGAHKRFSNGLYVKGRARYRHLDYGGQTIVPGQPTDRNDNQYTCLLYTSPSPRDRG